MTLTLIAVFGVFQFILILMHADIYQTLAAAFGLHWPWIAWLFVLLSLTFVTSSVLIFRFCNNAVKAYYRFSAYWFGLTQFLFAGAVGFFLLETWIYDANYYIPPAILGLLCFGTVIIVHSYATWQTARPKITRITAKISDSGRACPNNWRGKKIVFVSDLHLGAILGPRFCAKVVSHIEAESPEIVLIGGDIFDGVKCHSQELLTPFRKLHPPQGIYFASGNHEYFNDTPVLLSEIRNAGIIILNNEAVDICGIQFVGVDWKGSQRKHEFEKILADISLNEKKPSILMRHEPNHLDIAAHAGISLTLCGHTHKGQIWPLGYITHQIYRGFDYGFKKLNRMMVYTSSGVGTWGPPLRFGTKSEIVVITLA